MGTFHVRNDVYLDLAEIEEYIAFDSQWQAGLVRDSFFDAFAKLATFPKMAPLSEDWPGARRFNGRDKIRSYYIYYWVHESSIEILRVIHAERDQSQAIIEKRPS
ncbi:MAG: type II toxin-antitoxin system RelE/ParE family toxin [Planctomycetes bacterium]|nr:type II toxin-antitoxin system RelE/ParE family toxin [Planctomycetota bacterium]